MKINLTLSFNLCHFSSHFVRRAYDEHHNAPVLCAAPIGRPQGKRHGRPLVQLICVFNLGWRVASWRRVASCRCSCAGRLASWRAYARAEARMRAQSRSDHDVRSCAAAYVCGCGPRCGHDIRCWSSAQGYLH
jgi:hypothetical protein